MIPDYDILTHVIRILIQNTIIHTDNVITTKLENRKQNFTQKRLDLSQAPAVSGLIMGLSGGENIIIKIYF